MKNQQISKEGLRVINYLKKHNCCISSRWDCGLRVNRIWKDNKENLYPRISEETFCEISSLLEQEGDYQQTHFYKLKDE